MTVMTVRRLRKILAESLNESGGVKPEQATQLLKQFPKMLKKLGLDVDRIDSLPVLGTGERGTAFDLGGKVLKVTNDEKEAHASSVLVGKEIKNVVQIYAVWRFRDTPFFGILQEKLKPLPPDVGKAFNDALVATAVPLWIKRANGSWDEVKKLAKQHIISQVKKKFSDNYNSPQAQEYARGINEKWNALVNKFGLRSMFETLTQLGIDFHDYHAGNLMIRGDGTLVLIDLGFSKVKGGGGDIETVNQVTGMA